MVYDCMFACYKPTLSGDGASHTCTQFHPHMTVVVQSTTPGFPREKTARAPESLIASIARNSTRQAVTVEPRCGHEQRLYTF